ncbi:MAG: glucose-6-phosphate isomerase [Myxococcota bacterium]|nr:glucose-6-phosphate isomerase [Myxococcota bacterium]
MTQSSPPYFVLDLNRASGGGIAGAGPIVDSRTVSMEDLKGRTESWSGVTQALRQLEAEGQSCFARLETPDWGLSALEDLVPRLRRLGNTLVVLGMGGSALGARALTDALAPAAGQHRVEVVDSLDSSLVRGLLDRLDAKRTVVAAVSKSGSTVETLALLKIFQSWLRTEAAADWKQRIVFVTDPEEGELRRLAVAEGLEALPVPRDVGGRFSVLTAVGMLPASFLGLDVAAFHRGAVSNSEVETGPEGDAWRFALLHDAWWQAGSRGAVWMTYSERLRSLGAWYRQLWAESLGKRAADGSGQGWTPLLFQGPGDQHSLLQLLQDGPPDKLITLVQVGDGPDGLCVPRGEPEAFDQLGGYLSGSTLETVLEAEERGTLAALVAAGRPVARIVLPRLDEATLGALFAFYERVVAYTALLLGVCPFDQPGVEAGKRYAAALLGRPGYEGEALRLKDILDGSD